MSEELDTGRIRRRCPECLIEVDIAKPRRVLSADVSRSARKSYQDALRFQICWPALCPACTDFWNVVTRQITDPNYHPRDRQAA